MTLFSGQWLRSIFRCFVKHRILVSSGRRMSVVCNPIYAFYSCLFYRRWNNAYDWISLALPWLVLLIWNSTFRHIRFLHNPDLFRAKRTTKPKTDWRLIWPANDQER